MIKKNICWFLSVVFAISFMMPTIIAMPRPAKREPAQTPPPPLTPATQPSSAFTQFAKPTTSPRHAATHHQLLAHQRAPSDTEPIATAFAKIDAIVLADTSPEAYAGLKAIVMNQLEEESPDSKANPVRYIEMLADLLDAEPKAEVSAIAQELQRQLPPPPMARKKPAPLRGRIVSDRPIAPSGASTATPMPSTQFPQPASPRPTQATQKFSDKEATLSKTLNELVQPILRTKTDAERAVLMARAEEHIHALEFEDGERVRTLTDIEKVSALIDIWSEIKRENDAATRFSPSPQRISSGSSLEESPEDIDALENILQEAIDADLAPRNFLSIYSQNKTQRLKEFSSLADFQREELSVLEKTKKIDPSVIEEMHRALKAADSPRTPAPQIPAAGASSATALLERNIYPVTDAIDAHPESFTEDFGKECAAFAQHEMGGFPTNYQTFMSQGLNRLKDIPTQLETDALESIQRHQMRVLESSDAFYDHLAQSAPDDSASDHNKQAFARWIQEIRYADGLTDQEAREEALGGVLTKIKRIGNTWEPWANEEKCRWVYDLGTIYRDDLFGARKNLKEAQEKLAELTALEALINNADLTTADGRPIKLPPLFIGRVTTSVASQGPNECGFCAAWNAKEFLSATPETFFDRIMDRESPTGFNAAKALMLTLSGTRLEPRVGRVPFNGIPDIDIESEYLLPIVESFTNRAIRYANPLTSRGEFTKLPHNPGIECSIKASGITRREGIYMPDDARDISSGSRSTTDVGAPLLTHEALAQRLVDNQYAKCAQIFNNSELYRNLNSTTEGTLGGHWVTLGVIQHAFGNKKHERVRLYFAMDSATSKPETNLQDQIAQVEIEFIRRAFPKLIQEAIKALNRE